MNIDLEGRFYNLLGGWRDFRQKLGESNMDKEYVMDRSKLIVRNINKAKGVLRETRE